MHPPARLMTEREVHTHTPHTKHAKTDAKKLTHVIQYRAPRAQQAVYEERTQLVSVLPPLVLSVHVEAKFLFFETPLHDPLDEKHKGKVRPYYARHDVVVVFRKTCERT